ncbi:MAG: DUF5069 domain-containing protein [Nitrospirae bacterium]|nr:DUF5069 domain-containing protein [Nitrospirota bacterium]MBI3595317.1 DUF5069 domain-containing protein [Nitrospirota bacterium]
MKFDYNKIRSPREKLGGYLFLPRLIDKVRLQAKGELPAEYCGNLFGKGNALDNRLLQFTGLDAEKLREVILTSYRDEEVLDWVEKNAIRHTEKEVAAWIKEIDTYRPAPEGVLFRKKNYPELAKRIDIGALNVLDMIDMDEGRIPVK